MLDEDEDREMRVKERMNQLKKKIWDKIHIKKKFRNEIEERFDVKLIDQDKNKIEKNFEMMGKFLKKQIQNNDLLNQNPNSKYYQELKNKKNKYLGE